ncbi:MAG: ABC transporter permease [Acidimicrobiia bacterium]
MSTRKTQMSTRQAVVATATAFFRVDVIEEANYPISFAMRLLGVVAPLIPFFFISKLVGNSPEVGGDYLTFTVIGLAMTALLTAAMVGFGNTLQQSFQRGTMETFLIEPVPWTAIPLAMNQWQVMNGLIYTVLLMGAGWVLGAHYQLGGVGAAILIALLGITAGLAIGIVSAAVLLLTLKSTPVIRIYDIAASLLAGSLFSVAQLPGWAQALSVVLPHTYVINGVRTALMADPGSYEISLTRAVVSLGVFDVVVFAFGIWLWRRTLEYSRKIGLLGGY